MTATIVDTSAVLASLDEIYAEHEAIAAIIADADGLLVVSPMVAARPRASIKRASSLPKALM